MSASLVGSEMCIRDRPPAAASREGLRTSSDFEPRRGPVGQSGEQGLRAPGLDCEVQANVDQRTA
eukprot:7865863-Alexandrium_andersonii.AAC.1